MIKTWLKSPSGIRTITWLSSFLLRLLLASIRWQKIDHSSSISGQSVLKNADQNPLIFVNWHCRLLAIPAMLGKDLPTAYIISESQDGQLISGTVRPLGIETIWGSRSNKAVTGYRDMRRRLAQNLHVGITPDGPRGPARQAALGALQLAKTSGAALVPVAWSTASMWRLKSWDRLAIPKPFSRGIQIFGKAIVIPRDANDDQLQQARLDLEDAINALTAEADAVFGHPADDADHRYGIAKDKRNTPSAAASTAASDKTITAAPQAATNTAATPTISPKNSPKTHMVMGVYRALWQIIGLFLPLYLRMRASQGKEDLSRLQERYGKTSIQRPEGPLYWLHGVSVGETVSSIVLAEHLLSLKPNAHVLITSGTVTSAEMAAQRITSDRIIHQYHPHDHPRWVTRFLDHWSPELVVMRESEIWPNMVTLSAQRTPVTMASAQVSASSLSKWTSYGRSMAKAIFPCFELIMAVDHLQEERFQRVMDDPEKVKIGGSMKAAASALPDQPEWQQTITKSADGRQVILLASSHDQEEDLFIEAINAINQNNAYFAIIAPRHIGRGDAIVQMLKTKGGNLDRNQIGQRSKNKAPSAETIWWVNDAMGDMGALIRAADIIVLGGGFAALGGHNPMEMANLGKGIISGRQVFKNQLTFDQLKANNGVIFADHTGDIADAITLLSASPTALDKLNKGAIRTAEAAKDAALETASVLVELAADPGRGQTP